MYNILRPSGGRQGFSASTLGLYPTPGGFAMYCECGCGQETRLARKTSRARGWLKDSPLRFINGHSQHRPALIRFWEKVNKTNTCWLWNAVLDKRGYGLFNPSGHRVFAHRFAYELLVGTIPDGLEPDHLCRIPACVRPEHIELVTHRENVLRGIAVTSLNAKKTHCPQGHKYDMLNTYRRPIGGGRACKECNRIRGRQHYARLTLEECEHAKL